MVFEVSTFLALGCILLLYLQTPVLAKDKLTFCTVNTGKTHQIVTTECQHLEKSNNKEVRCEVQTDRISCLQLLLDGTVDFMTAEPEDLLVIGMTQEYNEKILVTQELRIYENASASYGMVVIVHRNIKNLWDTEQSFLCLPGLQLEGAAMYNIRYFEKQFLVSECDPRKTLLENRMSALSSYFKEACIGGPWTSDKYINAELKRKYQNLCFSCQNFRNCSSEDEYYGREGSLMCLTNERGNIAWARADDVLEHFRVLKVNNEQYKFLCPNGKTRTLNDDPCVWLSKPWRTIIARKTVAGSVSKFVIEQNLGADNFPKLFEEDLYRTPVLVDPFKTPNDYLEMFPEYYSLKDHVQCKPDRKIKWCVSTSIEYRKCKWLSDAAQSRGVEPSIECVQELSLAECLNSVRNCNSDMFVNTSLNEIEAKRKGLKPILSMMSNATNHNNEIVALVKKFSGFKSLEDLKYHKACFSGYRDAAWNAFIYQMRNLTGDNDWYCKDEKMVSKYFEDSCVVDLDSRNHTFPPNLYSICHKGDLNTQEKIALNCLTHSGDVAFLNLDIVFSSYKETLGTYYRSICVNESTSKSKPEERCSLTWTTLGSVLVHANISKTREQEIYLMLVELNGLFGTQFKGVTPQISMYGPFEGERNVIFHENTTILERYTDRIHRVPSYSDILLDIANHRKTCNDANFIVNNYFLIFVPLFYFLTPPF